MGTAALTALTKRLFRKAPPPKKLGFALAGLGKFSAQRLGPALQKTKHCRLAGIVTGTPAKASSWKTQYGLADRNIYDYDSMDRLADDPDVDVVYVVTPNALHAASAVKAANAGKHVFCEKPMEVSAEKCRAMIDACRKAGRRLAIAYRLDFEPHSLECIRLAREKVFGDLKTIEAEVEIEIHDPTQWRLNRDLAGGGPLLEIGIYALQATRRLTGEEPVLISATETRVDPANSRGIEESVVWEARFPSGVTARCRAAYGFRGVSRFRATADRGWFELDPAFTYDGIRGRRSDGERIRFPPIDQFASEMDDFAESILTGRPSKAPGEEGLRDVTILSAIYEAATAGKPVTIEEPSTP